jgi:hypothetical protein
MEEDEYDASMTHFRQARENLRELMEGLPNNDNEAIGLAWDHFNTANETMKLGWEELRKAFEG